MSSNLAYVRAGRIRPTFLASSACIAGLAILASLH